MNKQKQTKEKTFYWTVDLGFCGNYQAKTKKEVKELIKENFADEHGLDVYDDEIKIEEE